MCDYFTFHLPFFLKSVKYISEGVAIESSAPKSGDRSCSPAVNVKKKGEFQYKRYI